jgi:hypothetical protein
LCGQGEIDGNAIVVEAGVVESSGIIDQDGIIIKSRQVIDEANGIIDSHGTAVESTAIAGAIVKGQGFTGSYVENTAGAAVAADDGVECGIRGDGIGLGLA